MLITLSYVYLWLRFQRGYAVLLRDTLRRLQCTPGHGPGHGRLSFSFCRCSSNTNSAPRHTTAPHWHLKPRDGEPHGEPGVFLQLRDAVVYVTEPQACCDLSRWTPLRSSSTCRPQTDLISFIIEATGASFGPAKPNNKVLGWSELCVPLAHRPLTPGQPYQALAQASVEDFSRLGVAFIEDRLQLDDHLWPSKIVPVLLEESVVAALLDKSPSPEHQPSLCHLSVDEAPLLCRKGSLHLPPDHPCRLDERRGSEPLHGAHNLAALLCDPASQQQHMSEHGHHLHLSSCHECLQLENSTILSVKYASVENIPDLPDDCSVLNGGGDILEDGTRGVDVNSKPPNVLVYTGNSEPRFQTIQQVLSKSINTDNYMIYHLTTQQALSDPWLDNCRLLVVAEDTEQEREEEAVWAHLQTRFLTYLSGGGRVLGLVSHLCPAGVSLSRQEAEGEGRVRTLSFTREDSSIMQLRVQASGQVYTRDTQGGGEVELWGELNGGHMVIIRVTHGDDGGEAVLCQVHLEKAADPQSLRLEGVDQPTGGEELQLEVLEEILSSLGLSCEQSMALSPSPVHLLSTNTEAKSEFVKWLKDQADDTGLLRLPKVSLRLVSSSEAESDPPEGLVSLVWDSAEAPCPQHFSLQTYQSHLRSRLLGRTLLYAEVVSSTMDLLDGLNMRVPGNMGLVAVAAHQSHGRGRSRNGWLSPLGCAMFTVCLQVELSSRLGQRIPFLQHLVALAVVEAVRTLSGYEDLDLRVKWPNDIYHGSGLKLGGVLVTSTVLGSTFHLLVGCGFNVSNSSPTVCINDLIQRHNQEQGSSLGPLSTAQLIARSLSVLEELISQFQREGPDAVLPKYYSRWLHSGTRVRLWSEEGPEADVVGLDQNGFLQVHCPERGLLSLEPDGNSFDMLKNLLVMKRH
ncbi:biotin--protein ligase isoform X2 [Eucyclogobius newberryi]|uniref:biotin--protein ligase isoform X2 n=1 Tax=Eucyclogobius newberryi TaxID=166745 RepID=UPI003B5B31F5